MARVSLMGSCAVATLAALALAAALATLINAISAKNPYERKDCRRECRHGEHFTCEFDFEVHRYQTYSWSCKTCGNLSCTDSPGCIQADGITRLITVVNEELPGPIIQVCEGDTVKINVKNELVSSGVSIHWHGITMKGQKSGSGTPYMDGEPGVTQCHIIPNSIFTYSFVADPPGTHFWHAQSGFQRGDGVFGALIVKSPIDYEVNGHLYNEDLEEHIILLNDWTHILGEEKFFLHLLSGFTDYPNSILVNGVGPFEGDSIVSIPHTVKHKRFNVLKGIKYRFRIISGSFLNCPIRMSIDEHILTVISADGSSIVPYNVSSIVVHPGERWDIVLNANQHPQPYWISFTGNNDCIHDSVHQAAILNYISNDRSVHKRQVTNEKLPSKSRPKFSQRKPRGKELNGLSGICDDENVCLVDLNSTRALPEELRKERADATLYLGFVRGSNNYSSINEDSSTDDLSSEFLTNVYWGSSVNGFTFDTPSTPLIFQENFQKTCDLEEDGKYSANKCLHIIKIPFGSVTDIFLINLGYDEKTSSVHLHGFRFYVLSSESDVLKKGKTSSNRIIDVIKEMDTSGHVKRNLDHPVQKDTTPIPRGGFTLVRFLADNPGFWMLESQLLFESQMGMKLVLQVGELQEIPNPPKDFPFCGNFD